MELAVGNGTTTEWPLQAMLSTEFGDLSVCCPRCRQPNSHIATVYSRRYHRADEADAPYDGTTALVTDYEHYGRRQALVIEFDGECEHRWALVIQQHKGTDYLTVEDKGRSRLMEPDDE